MHFLIFQEEDMIAGEESLDEFKARLNLLFPKGDFRSATINEDLEMCVLPEIFWERYGKVIIIANSVPLDEVKLHIVTWWIEIE